MKFVKQSENTNRYVDNIFSVSNLAKKDPAGINATAGCLYDEEGKMLTYHCVQEAEKELTQAQKAAYASSPAGNKEYLDTVSSFVLEGKVTNHYQAIASPGGTGALAMAFNLCLDEGDTILYPEISWGNYKVMSEEFGYKILNYDVYDMEDLFHKIDAIEGKVFLVVNSPCHNPLGHSYTYEQWQKIIDKLNSLHKEAVLVCDIAYIDYANGDPKKYFALFNEISDDLLVLICASCSKAFSCYGYRLGCLIAINNDEEFLDHFANLASRYGRATWSNINNGGMQTISKVLLEKRDEYEKELKEAKAMLKKRSDLFLQQAKECGLDLYDLSDGFFATVRVPDNTLRDQIHQRLMDEHIYTIKVNKGIRVALCSVPLAKLDGLAAKLKEQM
ncbi:MAG: aminotransferase class I/II-fold pyridoxal phosphate-dependent enzyme [Erysipelotrichaceae bacterium]|nr:aminotransferase class I/II-fold pyridoxal phosphate-dependent enzyme [Erysipelotrichaceae bacterium]